MTMGHVAATASVQGAIGHWTEVGFQAVVGHGSALGDWSKVGPFAKVGRNVRFGPWAVVGMCSVIDHGAELGSHETVPSGHRRTRSGQILKLNGYSTEDWQAFRLFDQINVSGGPRCRTLEQAAAEDYWKEQLGLQLAALMPSFIDRHRRDTRSGIEGPIGRLLRFLSPPSTPHPPTAISSGQQDGE